MAEKDVDIAGGAGRRTCRETGVAAAFEGASARSWS